MRSEASRFEFRWIPLATAIVLCSYLVTTSANHSRLPASQDQERPTNILVALPRDLKNVDKAPAVLDEAAVVVSIPLNDQLYIGTEQVQLRDLGIKLEHALKRQVGPTRIVYIAGGMGIYYKTLTEILRIIRKAGVNRMGLIVNPGGNDEARGQFLVKIPPEPDTEQDLSEMIFNPLTLVVSISTLLELELNRDAIPEMKLEIKRQAVGTLNDSSRLSQRLIQIFQQRRESHAYKPGMGPRTEPAGEELVEKTIEIKGERHCRYGDVVRLIDVVKGAGALAIKLQIDDLR